MKIVVPSADGQGLESEVFPHFGRAPYYTIVEIRDGEIVGVESFENPSPEHGPGNVRREFFELLKRKGVEVVLAYGIGPRAAQNIEALGMRVIPGVRGRIGDVAKAFVEGRLGIDERWVEVRHHEEHYHERHGYGGWGCRRHERDLTFDEA